MVYSQLSYWVLLALTCPSKINQSTCMHFTAYGQTTLLSLGLGMQRNASILGACTTTKALGISSIKAGFVAAGVVRTDIRVTLGPKSI